MERFKLVTANEALAHTSHFDAVIDVRSEDEFALDRVPGAINCPVLNNNQRAEVGTLYKQVSPFQARKRGAVLVARNIARHLAESFNDMPRDWRPLVYCWRGGSRSASMAHVLCQVGWRTSVIDGGYNAYRRTVVADLVTLPSAYQFVVICGRTGSGKSQILNALHRAGGQVLDLEALARHRGSILGPDPNTPQPSQKAFESGIRAALAKHDPAKPVFVESESVKIGALRVPECLHAQMRASRCMAIDMPRADRVQFLLAQYSHLTDDPSLLMARLDRLTELHGRKTIESWNKMAHDGHWADLVLALIDQHYDPAYARSTHKLFTHQTNAPRVAVSLAQDPDLTVAAQTLMNLAAAT